ncbi:MAG: M3 family metallopeptidase [bacterium]
MRYLIILLIAGVMMGTTANAEQSAANPFFSEFKTPFGVPPFDKIKDGDYLPAIKKGIEEKQKEVQAIVNNTEKPTFENTIVAMEKSGKLLTKVLLTFSNVSSANTNPELQKIEEEMTPLLSKLSDEVNMNPKLFQRVKAVYESREKGNFTTEQKKLISDYYKGFARGGANLNDAQKTELSKINEEISMLTLQFGKNVLDETNKYKMVIDNKADLAGLPESVIMGAADEAKEAGMEGKWVFTLAKPSFLPFIQYAENRELRKKILTAYNMMGNNGGELDNNKVAAKIANLRLKKANILGYKTWADYCLEPNMAKTPDKVYELLNKLWTPALANAKKEVAAMQEIINKEGGKFKLEAWDWAYYAEKVKKAKYDLDEEQLRPYFKLENVRDGAFAVATKLYGITFTERKDIPAYHPDAKAFEVKEADGKHIGILYMDFFPRASKRGGAWMSAYRDQSNLDGNYITPVICNVCNFSKPAGDNPSLLSVDEVETLFHEFGHALHGLLSNNTYPSVSSTAVAQDFVELPSQIMENWALEPEVLKMYAKNWKTGAPMPDDLIQKIKNSSKFNQGFVTVEYLSAAILDMDFHTINTDKEVDVQKFEKASLDKMGLIPEIVVRYRSTYFRHIFGDPVGYSAGYYSYIWAAVLDADAFEAFKETSLFDKKTAESFRKNVISKGGTDEPMTLYKNFRGAEPKIEPLLKRRGLK